MQQIIFTFIKKFEMPSTPTDAAKDAAEEVAGEKEKVRDDIDESKKKKKVSNKFISFSALVICS